MAESRSNLGKSLASDLEATLTDEELVRLLAEQASEQAKGSQVPASEAGSRKATGPSGCHRANTVGSSEARGECEQAEDIDART